MTRILAFVAYWIGLDSAFYWLNRKAKRIITFHNVLPDGLFRAGVANGVSHSESDFKRIISLCSERFRFSTDLGDARTLTITFDDGYRNQYTTAFRILQGLGIPAYLYVAGGVSEDGGLIIDKLLHWVSEVPIEYLPNEDRLRYWCDEIWPAFIKDFALRGEAVLNALGAKFPYEKIVASLPNDYCRERFGAISDEELDEMRAAGWRIGWHTWSHYPLANLCEEAIREELDSPSEYRSTCLSFPYGNPCEVGVIALRIAAELGYPCAVANTNMASHEKYFLPRMALTADKYLLHFELSGCKYFLKSRRLLPIVRCNNDLD